jgi:hypothetical protein
VEDRLAECFRRHVGVGHESILFVSAARGSRAGRVRQASRAGSLPPGGGQAPTALDVEPADCSDTSPDVGLEKALDSKQ